jgi:hypothetical protein
VFSDPEPDQLRLSITVCTIHVRRDRRPPVDCCHTNRPKSPLFRNFGRLVLRTGLAGGWYQSITAACSAGPPAPFFGPRISSNNSSIGNAVSIISFQSSL